MVWFHVVCTCGHAAANYQYLTGPRAEMSDTGSPCGVDPKLVEYLDIHAPCALLEEIIDAYCLPKPSQCKLLFHSLGCALVCTDVTVYLGNHCIDFPEILHDVRKQ